MLSEDSLDTVKESFVWGSVWADNNAAIKQAVKLLTRSLWNKCAIVARCEIQQARPLTVLAEFHADRVGRAPACILTRHCGSSAACCCG